MVHGTYAAAASGPATAADTWGISGPAFLALYTLLAVAAAVYGFAQRTRIIRGDDGERPAVPLSPVETGMLFDDRRPVLAGLAQLRGHGHIDSTATPTLTPSRREREVLEPLSVSLLEHLQTSSRRNVPAMHTAMKGQLDRLRASLADLGYLLGPDQRKALFLAALPLDALLVLGIVRIIAGSANHHPVGYLILLMIPVLICAGLIMRPARLTRRGRRVRDETVRRNTHLRPGNSPAYAAYGADSAALAAALFGAAVLWSLDPGLAGIMGAASGGGGYSGSSCSSGDSGSSGGDSGGSSCGSSCGGGCGGGCGG
ncbi:TIGR04222 domain-containing membrane protein [Nocardia yamanashiensis]|uniref:TIGR04222 domain-containing membrane protein n=1 Tax=Nocardia yamanashiensis TaxID=209247 RepID=UPI00082A61AE|nr:TIGR04222 domain-containing membrane protein [Nocardia yamanashiensis]